MKKAVYICSVQSFIISKDLGISEVFALHTA